MGALVRAHDWGATPVGPIETWPQSLRTAVELILESPLAMIVLWGPELVQIYNEGYRQVMAAKHPAGLGQPTRECWPELWDFNAPIYEAVLRGESRAFSDQKLTVRRKGKDEEAWFDLTFSPLRDEDGAIAGVLVTVVETTARQATESALRGSVEKYETLFNSIDQGFCIIQMIFDDAGRPTDYRFLEVNAAFHRQTGLADPVGKRMRELEPEHEEHWFEIYGRIARTGKAKRFERPAEHLGRDYEVFAFRIGEPGEHKVGILFNDIAERKRSEAALRESEGRFRALVSATSYAVYRMSPDWTEMRQLDGHGFMLDTEAPRANWIHDYVQPDDQPHVMAAITDAIRTKSVFDLEHRVRRVDGSLGWTHSRAVPLLDDEGGIVEWFGAASDITERKLAEQHQTMLMAELDHRVKNVLAVVQSIARQSLGEDGSDASERLVGRLSALAQSHSLLARSRWEGAKLSDLVENAVAPYRGERAARVLTGGPGLRLRPKAAQTLTLALHELVTNAAKHGALSSEEGRVLVEWQVPDTGEDACLVLKWSEHGGPPVEGPPMRKGFGSRLIEQTLTYELDGDVKLEFVRTGFRAEFKLPLQMLSTQGGRDQSAIPRVPVPASGRPATLQGKRVLLVEDEHFVAKEMAEALRAAGCTVAGPVPTLARAVRAAQTETLDAAVVDINLDGELVWPAAKALQARGVPFLFATGYSSTIEPPPELAGAPWIQKPVEPGRLMSALAGLLAAVRPGLTST